MLKRRSAAFPLRIQHSAFRIQPRRGLTLIEMLMATAITLLMMAAIVNLFANLSGSISNRRAIIELSGQLRQVRQRLARDLAGCTVPPGPGGLMPWRQRAGEAIGYLEIIEGNRTDADPSSLIGRDVNGNVVTQDTNGDGLPDIDPSTSIIPGSQILDPDSDWVTDASALGDFDDILALTVRSLGVPFSGNYQLPSLDPSVQSEAGFPDPANPTHWRTMTVESNLAEVIWYAMETQPDDPSTPLPQDESGGREPGMRRIFRRVLLIAPWLANDVNNMRGYVSNLDDFVSFNDLSVRRDYASTNIEANTLADLTRREYRYGRGGGSVFPFPFEFVRLSADPKYVVLDDALAFDVRVYDSGAPLFDASGVLVDPNDPAWIPTASAAPANAVGYGAYVDLGWDNSNDYKLPNALVPTPQFQYEHLAGWHPGAGADPSFAVPNPTPVNPNRGTPAVYDTWSWHYENDGVDQYNDGVDNDGDGQIDTMVDLGRNGIDDDGVNGVDDVGERETSPPYPVPLRGVKVILRTYERDARQVREVSVTNSFVP